MHWSFVTTAPPTHRGGQGVAVEISRALNKVLPWQCGGNTQGLLYIGKKSRQMKIASCGGKRAVV